MIKKYKQFINEGRFYNDKLNPQFWDEDGNFNQRIRGKLLTIANDFFDSLELEDAEIKDIVLTGSLANYNYTTYSDFDTHIVIDFKEVNDDTDLVRMAVDNKRLLWNIKHNITIKGHDVELYIQDITEKHTASGVYSLLNDEWEIEPKHNTPEIDELEVDKKTKNYQGLIDKLDELTNDEDITMDELDTYFNYAKKLKEKIHSERKEGLDTREAEFSIENLVFKELRNSGHFGKLIDLINILYDKQFIQ